MTKAEKDILISVASTQLEGWKVGAERLAGWALGVVTEEITILTTAIAALQKLETQD